MVPSPPFVMRRPFATILAVLAMLTQVTLTVTAPLGLVFCIGETHAAVELAADDCCAAHGTIVPASEPTFERSCCSDVPLYAATHPIVDGARPANPSGSAALVTVAALTPPVLDLDAAWSAAASPPAARVAHRSVVLRV